MIVLVIELTELGTAIFVTYKSCNVLHLKKVLSLSFYIIGYKYFALGQGGKCYSGPNMGHTYFENGAALVRNGCKNGIGLQGHQYVYTFSKIIIVVIKSTVALFVFMTIQQSDFVKIL